MLLDDHLHHLPGEVKQGDLLKLPLSSHPPLPLCVPLPALTVPDLLECMVLHLPLQQLLGLLLLHLDKSHKIRIHVYFY